MPVTLHAVVRSSFDRTLFFGTWLALAVAIITGLLVALAIAARSEVGSAYALAFMMLFFFVSIPLHLGITVAALVRGIQVGLRPMVWIYAYLAITVAVHAVVGARLGAFDELQRDLAEWNRGREQPAQVALEKALQSPGNVAEVRAALAAGADPDAVNPRNPFNLLVMAAGRGDVEVVDAMLLAGADPDQRAQLAMALRGMSLERPSPLDAAAFSDNPQRLATVKRLLAAGADHASTHLRLGACFRGDLALLELAEASGAPDVVDRKGNTCLHAAAMGGHAAMVERLLRDGADANVLNLAQIPPLDAALARKKYHAALALARAGARSRDEGRLERLLNAPGDEAGLAELQVWLRSGQR